MIAIVIDSMERCYFISRLVKLVRGESGFLFLTSEPVAHLCLLAWGYESIYLRRSGTAELNGRVSLATTEMLQKTSEVVSGHMPITRASLDLVATVDLAMRVFETRSVSRCLIWNGQQLIGRAIAKACEMHGIPTRYLEISNLPDKLFVDPMGVNALSSIGKDASVLDELPSPTEQQHREWLIAYEQHKKRPLPQSRTRIVRKGISLLNYGAKIASRGVARKSLRALRVANALRTLSQARHFSERELAKMSPYVFLALQVSSDTQITLHSEVNNVGALEFAIDHAKKNKQKLLVKLHPAETDESVIAAIVGRQQSGDFVIVSSPSIDLLKNAGTVITINSTVGMEAMLYGKTVIALGRCLYREFDQERLLKYIHAFLIDGVDYFGAAPVGARAARRVLMLARVSDTCEVGS
jgi:capsular polysaccharide export protein